MHTARRAPPRSAWTGEAGRVAEGVQHVSISGERADARPVLALVQVEAGLVPDADGHLERHAVLDDPHGPGAGAAGPAERRGESFDPGRGRSSISNSATSSATADSAGANRGRSARHAQGEALGDQHGPVAVDDEPGQAVGLAPHQPSERRRRLTATTPEGDGRLDPTLKKAASSGSSIQVKMRQQSAGLGL
jgi:hypothetical protein